MNKKIVLVTTPVVIPITSMQFEPDGIEQLVRIIRERDPECVPDPVPGYRDGVAIGARWTGDTVETERTRTLDEYLDGAGEYDGLDLLLPEMEDDVPRFSLSGEVGYAVTHNELLAELAGRSCYRSFGEKAGQKTNRGYLAHTQDAKPFGHKSILYHPKFSFYLTGISTQVARDLIRHYVGADRLEEGSPSHESTRYTVHTGRYVVPPRDMFEPAGVAQFQEDSQAAHDRYMAYYEEQVAEWKAEHGAEPKGLDRKRIYEAAARRLPTSAETSLLWTTNPVALEKLLWERTNAAADLEFVRMAKAWGRIALARWPNLFSQALHDEARQDGWHPVAGD